MDNLVFKAVSFGINEQIMTLLAALGGLIKKSKKHLLCLLFIFALSSALPDIYAFTGTTEVRNKPLMKIKGGLSVFITEMFCAFLIGLPLLFINNKIFAVICSIIVGLTVIILNEKLIQKKTIPETIETCILAIILTSISYIISSYIFKKFDMKE